MNELSNKYPEFYPEISMNSLEDAVMHVYTTQATYGGTIETSNKLFNKI